MALGENILSILSNFTEGETAEATTKARQAGQSFGEHAKELMQKGATKIKDGASHAAEYAKEHPGKVAGGAAILGTGLAVGKYIKNKYKK